MSNRDIGFAHAQMTLFHFSAGNHQEVEFLHQDEVIKGWGREGVYRNYFLFILLHYFKQPPVSIKE